MTAVLALSLLIGLTLGLLGGGGSILAVPVLVFVAHLPTQDGIATSLLVVGVTSAAALFSHARHGRIAWRVGATFGSASMLGAFAGGRAAKHVPASWLLAAFTGIMVVTALAMIRSRSAVTVATRPELARALAIGAGVGGLMGVVGAGGGFVIVPALALLGGLPIRTAVGTSLLVIVMNSFAGLAGVLAYATIPWPVALPVTAVAVAGSVIGVALAGVVPPDRLRRAFGWFVLAMAIAMIAKQVETFRSARAAETRGRNDA